MLLSNVMLYELDQEKPAKIDLCDILDVMIFNKSKRVAERAYQNILKFIETDNLL